MLKLVATPIGNLNDITLRALEALKSCDAIFCEDTRHSAELLNHFGIKKPLTSCHEHNERARAELLCAMLAEGKDVCYISDAGMPGVSDPGAVLVAACIERGLPFTVLPGASAALMSAVYSGLPTERFTFLGFLPRTGRERRERLSEIAALRHTVILYESPHRVQATLKDLFETLGDVNAAVMRELTKKFECAERGKLSELIERFTDEPRGECVIAVDCADREAPVAGEGDIDAALTKAMAGGLTVRDAAAAVSGALGIPKKQAYARALALKKE